jgi:sugar lactone lactonase YvrE
LSDFGWNPFWLSDSKRLLFPEPGRKLFLVFRETGRSHKVLTVLPDRIHNGAAVSPDNRWIYFSRIVNEADIWMLTLDEQT